MTRVVAWCVLAAAIAVGVATGVWLLVILASTLAAVRIGLHVVVAGREERARARDHRRRELGLLRMFCSLEDYRALRAIIDRVYELAPADARRWELDRLLDHHVALAVERQRSVVALDRAERRWHPDLTGRSADLRVRRFACRDAAARGLETIDDELAALVELAYLYAGVATLPLDQPDDELAWRLPLAEAA